MVTLTRQLPTVSAGPLPTRVWPRDTSTTKLPFPRHWFTDETVTFLPGGPMVGDAVKVRRTAGAWRVVVVVGRDVLVAARVVDVDARVVDVVGPVVVWAC